MLMSALHLLSSVKFCLLPRDRSIWMRMCEFVCTLYNCRAIKVFFGRTLYSFSKTIITAMTIEENQTIHSIGISRRMKWKSLDSISLAFSWKDGNGKQNWKLFKWFLHYSMEVWSTFKILSKIWNFVNT